MLFQPAAAALDDAWAQMAALGEATGHADAGGGAGRRVRKRMAAAVAAVPASAKGLRVYHELDPTLYSATSETFIGTGRGRLGLVNIADAAATNGNAYPQLSAEYLVKAAPQVVVLADTVCCQQTAATFAARPGFATLPAVTTRVACWRPTTASPRAGGRASPTSPRTLAALLRATRAS